MTHHEVQSVDYAFTLTCKPQLYSQSIEQQFDKAEDEIKDRFNKIKGYKASFTVVCELTRSFNCHFHGIVKLVGNAIRPINFLRKFYDAFRGSKIIGHVFFKPVDNFLNWIEYIKKDIPYTYSNLKCRHPVIQNDYKIEFDLTEDWKLSISD